jgi:hypothetical protein
LALLSKHAVLGRRRSTFVAFSSICSRSSIMGLRRETGILRSDDPRRPKFDRVTRQEERAGLLDDTATIGTRTGWTERLREPEYELRGHRLIRSQ